jgi:hypothetical protein
MNWDIAERRFSALRNCWSKKISVFRLFLHRYEWRDTMVTGDQWQVIHNLLHGKESDNKKRRGPIDSQRWYKQIYRLGFFFYYAGKTWDKKWLSLELEIRQGKRFGSAPPPRAKPKRPTFFGVSDTLVRCPSTHDTNEPWIIPLSTRNIYLCWPGIIVFILFFLAVEFLAPLFETIEKIFFFPRELPLVGTACVSQTIHVKRKYSEIRSPDTL